METKYYVMEVLEATGNAEIVVNMNIENGYIMGNKNE